ncbi:MAG: ABC transporter ATP-binding protein [Eubacterium sp.]|nr:ABC transporter ATP-binding protein [Eubacterium sp.]
MNMDRKSSIKRLLPYLKKYRGSIAISLVLALITVILTLLIPVLVGAAIDRIVGVDNVSWDRIWELLIWIGAAAGVSAVSTYFMNICNNRVCYGVVREFRRDAFSVIVDMPVGLIDAHPQGDIVSRVVTDADAVSDGLLMGFSSLFTGGLTILGTIGFMFYVNAPIAIAVVAVTPLSLIVARFIARRSHAGFSAQATDRGVQTSLITEVVENIGTIQAFGQEDYYTKKFDETAEILKKDSLSAIFFSSITNPATRFVNSIVYAAVGVFGAIAAVNGGITVGMLSAFLGYANQYTKPFNEISGVITELQNAFACAERLFELMDSPAEGTDVGSPMNVGGGNPEKAGSDKSVNPDFGEVDACPGKTSPGNDGRVVFENVDFSYDKSVSLIENLKLEVQPGWRVAIVGPTGAGKSTIINLLMRFYDVNDGRITIDSTDIRDIDLNRLRSRFGMVLQETWLMTGTIRENIAFGCPDASDEEIVDAAKYVHAHGFINKLPHGYDTVVSGDGGLSAGEKQLICIARVMLKLSVKERNTVSATGRVQSENLSRSEKNSERSILILDEATSSIDTRTEVRIQRAFAKMMRGRTSFIVAHRLQTIREADLILVMRDGRIVEQGRHEELLAAGGFYRELYEASLQ